MAGFSTDTAVRPAKPAIAPVPLATPNRPRCHLQEEQYHILVVWLIVSVVLPAVGGVIYKRCNREKSEKQISEINPKKTEKEL